MPKAAVREGVDQPLEVLDVDVDAPHAGEVRVRMGASGVCHSDLSVVNGTLLSPLPSVLGHEGAGIVEEVGEGVTSVEAGDHVVLSFVPPVRRLLLLHATTRRAVRDRRHGHGHRRPLDVHPALRADGEPLHQMAGLGTFSEVARRARRSPR